MSKPETKQLKPNKVVTQDEFVEANIEDIVMQKLALLEKNEVLLAVTIDDKRILAGKEKLDKDGNIIFDSETGEPQRWPDSYYVDISFRGGALAIRVKPEEYQTLEIGGKYLGRGSISTRANSAGFAQLDVKFHRFEKLM